VQEDGSDEEKEGEKEAFEDNHAVNVPGIILPGVVSSTRKQALFTESSVAVQWISQVSGNPTQPGPLPHYSGSPFTKTFPPQRWGLSYSRPSASKIC
jgi:hypothetical protein